MTLRENVGYDHHCPWTSKCIGKGNLLFFRMFLGTTVLLIIYISVSSFYCLYLL